MAAKRVGQKAFDWVAIGSRIPSSAKGEFNAFRSRYETIKTGLEALPAKPAPVNWEFYKANVKNQALVAKFHEQYTKVAVPRPVDTQSQVIAQQEKEVEVEVVQALHDSKARIQQLQAELASIKAMKPFDQMTPRVIEVRLGEEKMTESLASRLCNIGIRHPVNERVDEYLEGNPELKKQIQDEIKEHNWSH